jgi:hypothetical protein
VSSAEQYRCIYLFPVVSVFVSHPEGRRRTTDASHRGSFKCHSLRSGPTLVDSNPTARQMAEPYAGPHCTRFHKVSKSEQERIEVMFLDLSHLRASASILTRFLAHTVSDAVLSFPSLVLVDRRLPCVVVASVASIHRLLPQGWNVGTTSWSHDGSHSIVQRHQSIFD